MDDAKIFAEELKALLRKHNGCISVNLDGDTHGIEQKGVSVSVLLPRAPGAHFRQWSGEVELTSIGASVSFDEV